MPTLFDGAPLPFKIVLGTDVALRPAPLAGLTAIDDDVIARAIRSASRFLFTGDLRV